VKFEISDVKAVSVVDRQLSVSVLINNEAALGQLFNFRVVYTHKGLSVEKVRMILPSNWHLLCSLVPISCLYTN